MTKREIPKALQPRQCAVPVVLISFNRPEETARVFAAIAAARPPVLLSVCDGPRADHPQDEALCAQVRRIVSNVDWPCEVHRNWAETNMGCGKRVSSGLDWAFTMVDRAIVLEDDCVPHPSFFPYCAELLERYADDERVFMITGHNHLGHYRAHCSYVFSGYADVWGWATWRRAWAHYDFAMSGWPEARDGGCMDHWFDDKLVRDAIQHEYESTYRGEIDTWDYQWQFQCLAQGGVVAAPVRNLVTNIGDSGAHTTSRRAHHHREAYDIGPWPLRHPRAVRRDRVYDRRLYRAWYAEHWRARVMELAAQSWNAYERGDYAAALRASIAAARMDPRWLREPGRMRYFGSIVKRGVVASLHLRR